MRSRLPTIFAAALLLCAAGWVGLPTIVQARSILYGGNSAGALFTINIDTGAGTLVGAMPFGSTEIVVDNTTRRAWSQQPDGSFTMHEFDINTAVGIGEFIPNGASFTGLEFVGATLYGTAITAGGGSAPSTLRMLDPATGASTVIGLTGVGAMSGLAYDIGLGVMYGIRGGPGPADLLTLDLSSGVATIVGSTGIQAGSLAFGPDGNLYAGGTGSDADNLYRIDPGTGASTFVGPTGFGSITGLTLVETNLVRISPPSGNYVTTQGFDLTLIIEAPDLSVVGGHATFDGSDVTAALASCVIPGTLVSGGQTFRCPGLRGGSFRPGAHTLNVSLNLSNGSSVSDSVKWVVLENTEP